MRYDREALHVRKVSDKCVVKRNECATTGRHCMFARLVTSVLSNVRNALRPGGIACSQGK